MKIVYIDIATDGHHLTYLSSLLSIEENEAVAILPQTADLPCKQYVVPFKRGKDRSFVNYMRWMKRIRTIVREEQADIVHFLYGDAFYRYFGVGLGMFRRYKTVVTMHWAKNTTLGRWSMRRISSCVHATVVHSAYIENLFRTHHVRGVRHIEYPHFNHREVSRDAACKYWGLRTDTPVIVSVGNTRYDKGVDLLLEALASMTSPFQLLIAGKEEAFDRAYIEEKTAMFAENVKLHLQYLTDEELMYALCAADIVALPYRKQFDGASGPLGEGVSLGKCIVGPNHGTLGYTVGRNHLGYTFESESVFSLRDALQKAVSVPFEPDEAYKSYRQSLDPCSFVGRYKSLYDEL